jgi:uncharacterized membrane protein
MTTTRIRTGSPRHTAPDWPIVAALLALSAIPLLGGIARLIGLSGNPAVTPENARFVAAPAPVVIHIVGATLFSMLGAFQFAPGLRRRFPRWHRASGRVLMASGLAVAASGVWMTYAYAIPPGLQGDLLYGFRLLIGSAMFVALVLSWAAILRRNVAMHRAWMLRAYAIGQGAGTQALILLPPTLLFGEIHGLPRDIWMIVAWVVNLMVAEWAIRRRQAR